MIDILLLVAPLTIPATSTIALPTPYVSMEEYSEVVHQNGRIPSSEMCLVSFTERHMLQCEAARDLETLNASFKAHFGVDIAITDSYRSYGQQVSLKARKGRWAAKPGTSVHGWGLAIDAGSNIDSFNSAEHKWMQEHAAKYNWGHPEWAHKGKGKPEPWHWEYTGVKDGVTLGVLKDMKESPASSKR